jgi:hypothetical protein
VEAGQSVGRGGIRVGDADDRDVGQAGEHAGMAGADTTGTDDSDADEVAGHHDLRVPRRPTADPRYRRPEAG